MIRPIHGLCCLAIVWILAGCSSIHNRLDTGIARQVDEVMASEIVRQELVGAAVGVLVDNQIVYLKGYGLEDRENKIPVTRRTLFRWASISKPLTAIAALQLEENRQLDLQADVRKYVPEFPEKNATITSRDLLCHQGGIVHYTNGVVIATQRKYDTPHPFKNVVVGLDDFRESPLVNDPGKKYSYTTRGYMLLSAVVQRAGKKKYIDQVQKRIAGPLGMRTLQPDYQWKNIAHRAVGYRKRDGKVIPSTNTDVSWKLGGGGFISNIDDLARFAGGLLNGRLVRKDTQTRMWSPQKLNSGKVTRYGLGFFSQGEGVGKRVGHSGAQEKTRTRMVLLPRKRLGVVLMCNSEHCKTGEIIDRVLEVLGVPPLPAKKQ
jgi:CubicO group peptidase (beta-lactamase class C family)